MRQATRFDWLAVKTQKKSVSNKNKPGLKQDHELALLENESIRLAQLIEQEKGWKIDLNALTPS